MDLFGDKAAILKSIVSNSYYGMLRRQLYTYVPPIWNNTLGIQKVCRIAAKVYSLSRWDSPEGNHGGFIHENKYLVQDDEYNYHDSLGAHLTEFIEGTEH